MPIMRRTQHEQQQQGHSVMPLHISSLLPSSPPSSLKPTPPSPSPPSTSPHPRDNTGKVQQESPQIRVPARDRYPLASPEDARRESLRISKVMTKHEGEVGATTTNALENAMIVKRQAGAQGRAKSKSSSSGGTGNITKVQPKLYLSSKLSPKAVTQSHAVTPSPTSSLQDHNNIYPSSSTVQEPPASKLPEAHHGKEFNLQHLLSPIRSEDDSLAILASSSSSYANPAPQTTLPPPPPSSVAANLNDDGDNEHSKKIQLRPRNPVFVERRMETYRRRRPVTAKVTPTPYAIPILRGLDHSETDIMPGEQQQQQQQQHHFNGLEFRVEPVDAAAARSARFSVPALGAPPLRSKWLRTRQAVSASDENTVVKRKYRAKKVESVKVASFGRDHWWQAVEDLEKEIFSETFLDTVGLTRKQIRAVRQVVSASETHRAKAVAKYLGSGGANRPTSSSHPSSQLPNPPTAASGGISCRGGNGTPSLSRQLSAKPSPLSRLRKRASVSASAYRALGFKSTADSSVTDRESNGSVRPKSAAPALMMRQGSLDDTNETPQPLRNLPSEETSSSLLASSPFAPNFVFPNQTPKPQQRPHTSMPRSPVQHGNETVTSGGLEHLHKNARPMTTPRSSIISPQRPARTVVSVGSRRGTLQSARKSVTLAPGLHSDTNSISSSNPTSRRPSAAQSVIDTGLRRRQSKSSRGCSSRASIYSEDGGVSDAVEDVEDVYGSHTPFSLPTNPRSGKMQRGNAKFRGEIVGEEDEDGFDDKDSDFVDVIDEEEDNDDDDDDGEPLEFEVEPYKLQAPELLALSEQATIIIDNQKEAFGESNKGPTPALIIEPEQDDDLANFSGGPRISITLPSTRPSTTTRPQPLQQQQQKQQQTRLAFTSLRSARNSVTADVELIGRRLSTAARRPSSVPNPRTLTQVELEVAKSNLEVETDPDKIRRLSMAIFSATQVSSVNQQMNPGGRPALMKLYGKLLDPQTGSLEDGLHQAASLLDTGSGLAADGEVERKMKKVLKDLYSWIYSVLLRLHEESQAIDRKHKAGQIQRLQSVSPQKLTLSAAATATGAGTSSNDISDHRRASSNLRSRRGSNSHIVETGPHFPELDELLNLSPWKPAMMEHQNASQLKHTTVDGAAGTGGVGGGKPEEGVNLAKAVKVEIERMPPEHMINRLKMHHIVRPEQEVSDETEDQRLRGEMFDANGFGEDSKANFCTSVRLPHLNFPTKEETLQYIDTHKKHKKLEQRLQYSPWYIEPKEWKGARQKRDANDSEKDNANKPYVAKSKVADLLTNIIAKGRASHQASEAYYESHLASHIKKLPPPRVVERHLDRTVSMMASAAEPLFIGSTIGSTASLASSDTNQSFLALPQRRTDSTVGSRRGSLVGSRGGNIAGLRMASVARAVSVAAKMATIVDEV